MVQESRVRKVAPLVVLLAAAMWGCSGTFARFLEADGFSDFAIAEIRMAFTAVAIVIFVAIYDRSLLKIRLRDVWYFLVTGLVGVMMTNFCYFTNIRLTSLSVAAILLYTAPVFVTILSRFVFKELFTRRKIIALVCAFTGCALVSGLVTGHAALSALGIVMGVASGLGYAIYTIFSQLVMEKGYHPFTVVAWTFIIAGAGGAVLTDWGNVATTTVTVPSSLPLALVAALVGGGIPYTLYTAMLPHMETSTASILSTFEPVMATILGAVIFGEIPSPSHLVGIILVIFAVILLSINSSKDLADAGDGDRRTTPSA